jgi:hypothetical protein
MLRSWSICCALFIGMLKIIHHHLKNMDYKQPSNNILSKKIPSPRDVVRSKIIEFELAVKEKEKEIRFKLRRLYAMKTDSFTEWFIEQVIKVLITPEIDALRKNLFRPEGFWRLLNLEDGMKKRIETEEKIKKALQYPIEKLAKGNLNMKQFGEKFVYSCPFCNDKFPSLHIFPKTNTSYCSQCQKESDVIILTMQMYGLDFREAVEALQNQDE